MNITIDPPGTTRGQFIEVEVDATWLRFDLPWRSYSAGQHDWETVKMDAKRTIDEFTRQSWVAKNRWSTVVKNDWGEFPKTKRPYREEE